MGTRPFGDGIAAEAVSGYFNNFTQERELGQEHVVGFHEGFLQSCFLQYVASHQPVLGRSPEHRPEELGQTLVCPGLREIGTFGRHRHGPRLAAFIHDLDPGHNHDYRLGRAVHRVHAALQKPRQADASYAAHLKYSPRAISNTAV